MIKLEAVQSTRPMSGIVKYPVVILKQNSDTGFLIAVKQFLNQRMNPADVRMDQEKSEIVVHNHSTKEVRKLIKQFNRGLGEAGHGGFRGHAQVEEREINLKQELRTVTAQRDALEQELESERQHEAELGDKWGNLRRDYEQDNDILRKGIRRHKARIRKLKAEYDQTVVAEREKQRQQMLRWRHTSLWKVGWQRLLALVDSEREG